MIKKLLTLVTIFTALLIPVVTSAQVFSQYQLINQPLGGGVVVSTSTKNGDHLGTIATSSLKINTGDLIEGSNLFYTTARSLASFITNLAATTSVASITTLPSLSLPYVQITGVPAFDTFGYPFPANATTSALTFGGVTVTGIGAGTINSTSGGTLYSTGTSTPAVTAPIGYSGTLGQFIGGISGNFTCAVANGTIPGCLSATDYNTFNGKQAAGNYITALTGDVTASGPGSVAATLATVNGNVGTFTYPSITVNGKGLITAISNGSAPTTYTGTFPISISGSVISSLFSTTSNSGIAQGNLYVGSGGIFQTSATTSVTNGTGISFSGTAGALIGGSALTITNSGVTSNVAGTGISVSGATGAVTITNTGVTSIVAGTNVTISGATGAVTINASGGSGGSGTVSTSTNEVAGRLAYFTSNSGTPALLGQVATSAPTVSAPITYSGTLGSLVGGVGGAFGCTNASAGVTGCLTGTDWNTFNNKLSSDPNWNFLQATGGNYLTPTTTTTGIILTASSTIGNGTQGGGLTISGGATTTGTAYFAGSVGIGTSTPFAPFALNLSSIQTLTNNTAFVIASSTASATSSIFTIDNIGQAGFGLAVSNGFSVNAAKSIRAFAQFNSGNGSAATPAYAFINNSNTGIFSPSNGANVIGFSTGGNEVARFDANGRLGLGTTTPYAQLSIVATSTTGVNAATTLFAIASSTGGTSTSTLFSISNTGGITTNLSGSGFVKTSGAGSLLTVDTNTYLTANQTITLSGAVTGSGATAITTTFGNASAGTVLDNPGSATAAPTFNATSTLYGAVQNGKVLAGLNGILAYVATTSDSCGTGVTCSFSGGVNTFSIANGAITDAMLSSTFVKTLTVSTAQGVSGSFTAGATPALSLTLGALTGVTSFNGLIVTANTGTITTGIWNGTTIAIANGGTNASSASGAVSNIGAATTTDVQIFTATGGSTWTKPIGAKSVYVIVYGGGGGGGAGAKGAAANARCGGGGAAGGGYSFTTFAASVLGTTETVTVGVGGAGGASQVTNSTNGANGVDGGDSSFGLWIQARHGNFGSGGTVGASSCTGFGGTGAFTTSMYTNPTGGSAGTTGGVAGVGNTVSQSFGTGSGGAGGGISTGNTASNGANGGQGSLVAHTTFTGGTGGVVGGASPGTAVGATANTAMGGAGGGGGAGSTSGVAQGGTDGAIYGGGGSGGGASTDSVGNSGAGGKGGNGIVIVITTF